MARVNISILGISELKSMGIGKFNSDYHYIYDCGEESLRRNGVALIANKQVWNAVLRYNLKNNRMILVHFQGKPFNIIVIQVYAPTTDAKEAEVDWVYKDLQYLIELTWSRSKGKRVLSTEYTGQSKHSFPTTKEMPLHMSITR